MTATRTYSAHGLRIASPIALSDLPLSDEPANVALRFAAIDPDEVRRLIPNKIVFERPGCRVRASRRAMLFDWKLLGRILISDGVEVVIDPDPDTLEEDLQPFLTGPVLAVLMHQRGRFVLHASAVDIFGRTVAFLGQKGDGKSTLAAFMRERGHRLVSDDIVPVVFGADGRPSTVSGYPRIKLYDDSLAAVGATPEHFPVIHRFVEKRSFNLLSGFIEQTSELAGVCVLGEAPDVELKPLAPLEAFVEVVRNTHLGRYIEALDCRAEHLENCRRIVSQIPVMELNRPHDYARMTEVAETIEKAFR